MEWTRSETVALALDNCTHCHGIGLRVGNGGKINPCNCVLRSIFRACYARFRQYANREKFGILSPDPAPGRDGGNMWGRKEEEYVADFCLVSRRYLNESEYKIFKYYFLLRADWKLCCRKLNIDRGKFFHAVYRIEQKLGRIFRELEPYPLYPLEEYFHGPWRKSTALPGCEQRDTVVPFRKPARPRISIPGRKAA